MPCSQRLASDWKTPHRRERNALVAPFWVALLFLFSTHNHLCSAVFHPSLPSISTASKCKSASTAESPLDLSRMTTVNRRHGSASSSLTHTAKKSIGILSVRRGGAAKATTSVLFDNAPLVQGWWIIVLTNALGYAITRLAPRLHYHVDLLGTGAFALAAAVPLLARSSSTPLPPPRVYWSAAAVTLWSVKLASFLCYRVVVQKHDGRLDDILASPSAAAGFWIVSAVWGLATSLPHALGATSNHAGHAFATVVGLALYAMGWAIETTADYQKWMHKRQLNVGVLGQQSFCHTGLWSLSQHPNWFGNLLLWIGIFVMNAPALLDLRTTATTAATATRAPFGVGTTVMGFFSRVWRQRRLGVALLGPLFLATLFYTQSTGMILADAFQATRERYGYGTNLDYTQYVDQTPILVPSLWHWWHLRSKGVPM